MPLEFVLNGSVVSVPDARGSLLEGLLDSDEWAERFVATGASRCGFCTPGIIMRLAALDPDGLSEDRVRDALLARLCRCTGWNTIVEAVAVDDPPRRDLHLAAQRAAIEGGVSQRTGVDAALGRSDFPCDTAPHGAFGAAIAA